MLLPLLSIAAATTLMMLAALYHVRLKARHGLSLSLSLIVGACYFTYIALPNLRAVLLPVTLLGPLACNIAFREAFELTPRPRAVDIALALMSLSFGLIAFNPPYNDAFALGFNLLAFGLFAELPWMALRVLSDDLDEARRNQRLWLLFSGAVACLLITAAVLFTPKSLAYNFGAGVAILLSFTTIIFWPLEKRERKAPTPTNDDRIELTNSEKLILSRLMKSIHIDKIHLNGNTTLYKLSAHLGVPEHQLRKVIHIGTNHKNFSAFLNSYRLEHFKSLAADINRDTDTILSLALECGYNSLAAFNRGFKNETNMTPSDYRRSLKTNRMMNSPDRATEAAETDKASMTGPTR